MLWHLLVEIYFWADNSSSFVFNFHSDAVCFHNVTFHLIVEQLIFNILISSMSHSCIVGHFLYKSWLQYICLSLNCFNVDQIFILWAVHVVNCLVALLSIDRLVEQSYLVELSRTGYLSVDLPVESLLKNPVWVKWVVVQVTSFRFKIYLLTFVDYHFDPALDVFSFFFLALMTKQLVHCDGLVVPAPLMSHLLLF